MLSIEFIRSILNYDPETGEFRWANGVKGRAGELAGGASPGQYARIGIQGRKYAAHRLAWAMHFGCWPERQIDHVNRVITDNRIANLRLATASENGGNRPAMTGRRSVFKGVCRNTGGNWRAQIKVDGVKRHLGSFASESDAARAYDQAAKLHFGQFAYLNFPSKEVADA